MPEVTPRGRILSWVMDLGGCTAGLLEYDGEMAQALLGRILAHSEQFPKPTLADIRLLWEGALAICLEEMRDK